MQFVSYVSYFFGGAFITNAIPHFVAGLMGRPFQSPFASPSGQGLSTSTVNVLWGFFNFIIGYLLVCRVGMFDLRSNDHVIALGLGALFMSVITAACSVVSTAVILRADHENAATIVFTLLGVKLLVELTIILISHSLGINGPRISFITPCPDLDYGAG
jgi:hypothetical protein